VVVAAVVVAAVVVAAVVVAAVVVAAVVVAAVVVAVAIIVAAVVAQVVVVVVPVAPLHRLNPQDKLHLHLRRQHQLNKQPVMMAQHPILTEIVPQHQQLIVEEQIIHPLQRLKPVLVMQEMLMVFA
jgi:hypothetical protein